MAASMRLLVRGHEGLDYGKVSEVRTRSRGADGGSRGAARKT